MLKKAVFQTMTEFNKKIFYDTKAKKDIVNIED